VGELVDLTNCTAECRVDLEVVMTGNNVGAPAAWRQVKFIDFAESDRLASGL